VAIYFILLLINVYINVLYQNWHRMARTGVFGNSGNKFAPENPGKIEALLRGSSSHSKIKGAGLIPLGNNKGQNGAEIHLGTIRVVACACLITLGIK